MKIFAWLLLLTPVFPAFAQDFFGRSFDCRRHAEMFHEPPLDPQTLVDTVTEIPAPPITTITDESLWKQWKVVENFAFGKDRGRLTMIADLQALHPVFRDKVRQLISNCKLQGIELAVVESYRTHAKQNEYKIMGKQYTSSGAGLSKHQYGLAVDLVPMVEGLAVWDNKVLWNKIGVTGEKLGLRWGGRWKSPYDPGHFEWTAGLTLSNLAAGEYPNPPEAVEQYPCLLDDINQLRVYWKEWETLQAATVRK